MPAGSLLAFLLLDIPAALALFGGATMLFTVASGSRAVGAVCGLALVAGYAWALFNVPSYLLPAVGLASNFGEFASDMVANITAETFLHRGAMVATAAGLVALGVRLHWRPADGRRALAFGAAFCAAGLTVPLIIGLLAADRLALRETWRSAHVEALKSPGDFSIDRVQGLVRIAPGHGIEIDVTLRLAVAADHSGALLFSFNPGMTVRELRLDGQVAAYTHEHGLLAVSYSAEGAVQASLRLRATGAPDADFAYLDSPLEWRKLPGRHPLLRLGRDATIDEQRLVALMPAARWLPAVGANVGQRRWDPFELDLLVEAPRGWLVAGPGRRRTAGDRVRFAPVASVADVGLVAGVFAQRAIDIAGVHVELLAAPGHLDNVGDLAVAGPLAARLGELFDRLTGLGLAYPHAGLTLVEVPMRLRTYGDGWRMTSVALPAIYLLREAHLTTPRFGRALASEATPKEHALAVEHYFTAYTRASGNNPVVGLARQAFAQQTAADGPSALALGFVLNDLAAQLLGPNLVADRFSALETDAAVAQHRQELTRLISATWGGRSVFGGEFGGVLAAGITWPVWGPQRHPFEAEREADAAWHAARVALTALDACATAAMHRRVRGGDAPPPTQLASNSPCTPVAEARRLVAALHLKGGQANAALLDTLGPARSAALLADIRRRHAGSGYQVHDVANADPGADVGELLELMLAGAGLPGFVASPAAVSRLADSGGTPRYQTRVRVLNDQPVDGMLRLAVGGRQAADAGVASGAGLFGFERSLPVRIAGNTAVEMGLVTAFPPERISLWPYLSLNRTDLPVALPIWADDIVHIPPLVGARPSDWRPASAAGIIVDDLDPGFSIALAAEAALGEHQGSPWLPHYPPDSARAQWSRQHWESAWGKYRRTVARTLPGDGRHAAVFRVLLSVPGRWRLQYHWPTWRKVTPPKIGGPAAAMQALSLRRYFDKQGTYDMRVATAAHTTAVDFNGAAAVAGWNTLGDFDLDAGEVRLIVSDETPGDSVVADAIRWLRVDAPEASAAHLPDER